MFKRRGTKHMFKKENKGFEKLIEKIPHKGPFLPEICEDFKKNHVPSKRENTI